MLVPEIVVTLRLLAAKDILAQDVWSVRVVMDTVDRFVTVNITGYVV